MKHFLTCFLILLLGCATPKQTVPIPTKMPSEDIRMSTFLEDAVYYGLQVDAAPKEMVDKVLNGKLFVTKCPICRPVEAAMNRHLKNLPDITIKRSKDSVVAKMMNAETREHQQLALRDLISAYVSNYYDVLKLSTAAQTRLKQELENGRKKGMGLMKEGFGEFCPSCDGACKIKMKE